MAIVGEILVSFFLVVGGLFSLTGSIGLVKLDNPMSRLHAPTKAGTLGVGGILAASMIHAFAVEGAGSLHELLIMAFVFVTAPISALFVAKAHIHRQIGAEALPRPGEDRNWAVLDAAGAGTLHDAAGRPEASRGTEPPPRGRSSDEVI